MAIHMSTSTRELAQNAYLKFKAGAHPPGQPKTRQADDELTSARDTFEALQNIDSDPSSKDFLPASNAVGLRESNSTLTTIFGGDEKAFELETVSKLGPESDEVYNRQTFTAVDGNEYRKVTVHSYLSGRVSADWIASDPARPDQLIEMSWEFAPGTQAARWAGS
jgi:hypothetical protein